MIGSTELENSVQALMIASEASTAIKMRSRFICVLHK
jgi:hypothetical protein